MTNKNFTQETFNTSRNNDVALLNADSLILSDQGSD